MTLVKRDFFFVGVGFGTLTIIVSAVAGIIAGDGRGTPHLRSLQQRADTFRAARIASGGAATSKRRASEVECNAPEQAATVPLATSYGRDPDAIVPHYDVLTTMGVSGRDVVETYTRVVIRPFDPLWPWDMDGQL